MTASVSLLGFMVTAALVVTAIAPLLLLGIWLKDWKNKELW